MPKSYLSDEEKIGLDENMIFLCESHAAAEAGDRDAEWEWLAKAELPAYSLMRLKKRYGADWVRKMGFRTEPAEKVYGKDWLDREA